MRPSNRIHIINRTFDYTVEVVKEVGKYENIMLSDLNIPDYLKDATKAFKAALVELELNLKSQLGVELEQVVPEPPAKAKEMQDIEEASGLLNRRFKVKGRKEK